ncbi:MAG TPA: serine hydrolase, partial [Longimicrobiales bacterium]
MGRLEGNVNNLNSPELQHVQEQIRTLGIGGFAVGIGDPAEIALKMNALQRIAPLPLLVASDLEWGPAMRLWPPTYLPYGIEGAGGTAFPFNMGIAATGDPALADTAGRVTGEEARAVGINWVFAPVLDVNNNPANPVINVRSYGANPQDVARFGAAFIRGAERARVLTAAKHFPGHGDTNVDSHVGLPILPADMRRLDTLELVPFRAGLAAGVSAVMLGHLALPAIIGDSLTPATISPRIGASLLRGQLHFGGIVVTDAMTMGALRNVPGYTPGEIAVRAVEAGNDIVLGPPDLEQAHAAIVAAVKSGRISPARIDSSVARILGAKAWLGLNRERTVALESVNQIVASPAHEAAAAQIAEKSITLARDAGNLVPLDPRQVHSLAIIAFSARGDMNAGRVLADALGDTYGKTEYVRLDPALDSAQYNAAFKAAQEADAVIFATFFMPVSGQGYLRVPRDAEDFAARLAQLGKPTVVVSFGDPYGPANLPIAGTYMLAWQAHGSPAQVAAAHALAGTAPITGVLPIDVPGTARGSGLKRGVLKSEVAMAAAQEVGLNPSLGARVDSIINAALADHATPGAAVAIGRHGRIVKLQGYGSLDYRPGFGAVTDSTLYDLASLTKVIGTTTATMLLYDEHRIDLDAPIARYLPEFLDHPDKKGITVRNLLLHTAGFRPFAPLYRSAHNRQEYLKGILELPLENPPGTKSVYSDFSMITLGMAIERLTGKTLDEFLQARVFRPLGMRDTHWNPDPSLLARIAPTEIDTIFRKIHVHGVVHDENAYAMGGISGHAGLFSSARDLAKFAQMMLNEGYYAGRRYITPQTIRLFTRRQSDSDSRALGWDTPSPRSSAGDYFSAGSFGHTGFTGTSIWVDPEKDLYLILLTNRVNPTRDNQKVVPLRRALADAVQQAVTDVPVTKRDWGTPTKGQ